MSKQYLDVSKIKLDETGRTVLDEERLLEIETSSKAGADIWQDLEDWWNTNNGSCSNVLFCDGETNPIDCTNHFTCSDSTNDISCLNKGCPDSENSLNCRNTRDCP